MSKPRSLWTGEPHADSGWAHLDAPTYSRTTVAPQASENVAESKVLLYGPKGEPLVEQKPRAMGFRKP